MNSKIKWLLIVIVAVVVAFAGYAALTKPDTRTTGEKVEDAVDDLGNGLGDAAEELEDRTPAERIGDAIEDAGDSVQEQIDNTVQ